MSYTLQILHASDLEGGVEAIGRAENFAAIVDYLEDTTANSLTLSAGDNYLPGPFFDAANTADIFRDTGLFNEVYNTLFGLPADVDGDGDADAYAGLREGGGRVDISIMNILGFDASALGNHEFDLGTGTIAELIEPDYRGEELADDRWTGTQFPYLSANLDFSADPALSGLYTADILRGEAFDTGPAESLAGQTAPKIAPATIIEEGGELIGVVGATTPLLDSISSPGDTDVIGPTTNDMQALADVLQPVVDAVIAQGVNKVVLVTHLQQIALEQELAGLLTGVDVIVAGGSDTLLADDEDISRGLNPGDEADGGYPLTTTSADGNPVVIVSTDGQYSYVGRLVVEFDDAGVIQTGSIDADVSGAYATTEDQVTALYGSYDDAFTEGSKGALVRDLTDAAEQVVVERDGNVIGETAVYLDGERESVRTEETNLGNLTADANLFVARQYDETVQVSIKNGGGIRAPIGEIVEVSPGVYERVPPQGSDLTGTEDGDVSQLDAENSLKFNNALTLQTLTAEQLLQVLEHAVAESGEGATPGQFAQVGGIEFSYDLDRPAGDRIVSAAIVDDAGTVVDVLAADGEVVGDAARDIRVVTLNFLQGGGDGYPFDGFAQADPDFADVVQLADVLTDPGLATFAAPGTEQDAFAEYMRAMFSETPFDQAETPPAEDTRIQNLDAREDTVLEGLAIGTDGDDKVFGADGADRGILGAGDDKAWGRDGADTFDMGAGDDKAWGDDGADTLSLGAGDDKAWGGDGNDVITAGAGDDKVWGDDGDDILVLGAGADKAWGGAGADTLHGGEGDDDLYGGHDADLFVVEMDNGADTIRDFEAGVDRVDLSDWGFSDVAAVLGLGEEMRGGVMMTLDEAGGDSLFLGGVRLEDLGADTFIL